ncbi:MAG: 50S ribosomal protein L6 [Rickettsiales bacterium]|jgi:large subunit ribosomal protein L6|nr:50S ribosomal protein L6 [Rickettsiales bacterium]
MSRLGKLPVAIPEKVTVSKAGDYVVVKGPKGELKTPVSDDVVIEIKDGKFHVNPANETQRARAMWGTVRSNVKNLVEGVTAGYKKQLDITGVGFRAAAQGQILTLALGFSHEVKYIVPKAVTVTVDKQTTIFLSSADRQKLGQVAAEIRSLRPPEPYKGKGIKYSTETVRRKEGKKK